MGLPKLKEKVSVEDYLEGEKISRIKHEYVYGEVYAMAGASVNHNRVTMNLASRLHDHLRDSDCEAFVSDMKVRVDPETYYYPDVVVTCESFEHDQYTSTEPRLVIEVISDSTGRIDKGEKLFAYKRVPSLQEYVIVEQDTVHVEVHRRVSDDVWETKSFNQMDKEVTLSSVGLTLNVSDIYRNVRFEDAENE